MIIHKIHLPSYGTTSFPASSAAEALAPGESGTLLEIAGLNDIIDRRSSNTSTLSRTPIDDRYLQYLINMYHAYEEKGLPFNEQVRVLSLIPESWNLTSGFIEENFNCSNYAVKLARRLNKDTSTPLHVEEKMYELSYNIFIIRKNDFYFV